MSGSSRILTRLSVEFMTDCVELASCYASADVFAFPSFTEVSRVKLSSIRILIVDVDFWASGVGSFGVGTREAPIPLVMKLTRSSACHWPRRTRNTRSCFAKPNRSSPPSPSDGHCLVYHSEILRQRRFRLGDKILRRTSGTSRFRS